MDIDQPQRLSVIVPCLNEARRINDLFDALQCQTRPADEIIIADANSKDETRQIAASRGGLVVDGGMPGVGRNAGANAASGDIYLFLDADVVPAPDFIEKALAEFHRSQLGIATTLIEALEDDGATRMLAETTNLYLLIMQHIKPHAPGFCILTRRDVHHAIGGFDETAKMAEDHDYVQRAAQHSKFGVITGVRIAVSMRRLEKEGLVKLALKYLWAEMHALAGKPVYSMPFDYDFGTHDAVVPVQKKHWIIIDITNWRRQMTEVENPLLRLSSTGRYHMERLIHWESSFQLRQRIRLGLNRSELGKLQRYLSNRLAFVLQNPPRNLPDLGRLPRMPFGLPGPHNQPGAQDQPGDQTAPGEDQSGGQGEE